jgi:hypothetical protein
VRTGVDKAHTKALVFRLAREERDAWVNWPARVAALIAAELSAVLSDTGQDVTLETSLMQKILETQVRVQLEELGAHVRFDFS